MDLLAIKSCEPNEFFKASNDLGLTDLKLFELKILLGVLFPIFLQFF